MKVSQINKTDFRAGSIYLKNIKSDTIKSCDAIKKMAEDKNIDVFIAKRENSYYLPTHDLYTIVANRFNENHSVSCELVNKKTKSGELSVRLFNAAITAIENLERKIAQ